MADYADLPDKTLLRPDEVAEFFSVSVRTIYNWCETMILEGTVVANTLRVFRTSVISLAEAGRDMKRERDDAPRSRRVISKGVRT